MIEVVRRRAAAALSAGAGVELSPDELRLLVQLGFDAWLLAAGLAERALETLEQVPPNQPAYSPARLAERWSVSLDTIYAAIKTGELQAFRFGGKLYRIRREEVERYENGR